MARSKASQAGPAKKPAGRTAGGRAASENVATTAEAPDVGAETAAGAGDEVPPAEAEAAQDGDVAGELAQAPDEDGGEGAEADSESEPGTEVMGRPLFEALSDAERILGVRVDLAEAVAIVNAERVHSELEKWQMVADERERSLERADLALDTVARAVESAAVVAQVAGDLGAETARRRQSEEPSTEPDDVVAWPSRGEPPGERAADAADAAPGAKSNVVEIPVDIRAEARRYAEVLRAAERAPKRRTWRSIWR